MIRIVALSGRIGSGKTTLAVGLAGRYGMRQVSTRELIKARFGPEGTRAELQRQGEQLDRRTHGRWLADALGEMVTAGNECTWAGGLTG
jgi:dephospho-CoA kinase